jgi:hypothetical protein
MAGQKYGLAVSLAEELEACMLGALALVEAWELSSWTVGCAGKVGRRPLPLGV